MHRGGALRRTAGPSSSHACTRCTRCAARAATGRCASFPFSTILGSSARPSGICGPGASPTSRTRARAAGDRADRNDPPPPWGPGKPSGRRPRPLRPERPRRRRNLERLSRRPECPGPVTPCTPTAQPRIRRTHRRIRPRRQAARPPHTIGRAERPSLPRANLRYHIPSRWTESELHPSIPPAKAYAGAWYLVLAAGTLECAPVLGTWSASR
jgi:hypothetical protein